MESNPMTDLLGSAKKGVIVPHDPYSHSALLLQHRDEVVKKFTELVSREVLLANIGEDKTLRLYQNDIMILTAAFDMALRDPAMMMVFYPMYYGWLGELAMTRTKDGLERKMQATPSGFQPPQMYGYGMPIDQPESEKAGNFLGNMMGKFQGKK